MSVRVGTSGWSYPGGRGTWNGVFYPEKHARPRGFDELEFYARWFDVVEVNSTFYGQPRARVTAGWVERTPPGFEFAVKLFQKFTHPAMFLEALSAQAPGAERGALESRGRGRVRRTWTSSKPAWSRWRWRASSAPCWCSSRQASPRRRTAWTTWDGCCAPSRRTRSRWNCGTSRGATRKRRRRRCSTPTAPRGCRSTSRNFRSRFASGGYVAALKRLRRHDARRHRLHAIPRP